MGCAPWPAWKDVCNLMATQEEYLPSLSAVEWSASDDVSGTFHLGRPDLTGVQTLRGSVKTMSDKRVDSGATQVSRRTVMKGAAWSVPVVVVASAAPALAAASCEIVFTATGDSRKCCNGQPKNMKLILSVAAANGCAAQGSQVCITNVRLATGGGSIGSLVYPNGQCAGVGGTITVYLLNTSNCTVNLLVDYTLGAGPVQTAPVQSDNIPSGNTDGECLPPA